MKRESNRRIARTLSVVFWPITLTSVGCDALLGLFSASTITITLVNQGDFIVDGTFLTSDTQEIPELLLTQTGDATDFVLQPGQSMTFIRSCDDVQALMIEDADLQVLGGIGPEAQTGVFRDGDDFGCGDRITLTFSHPATPLTLDIDARFE
jgi:hypothetical protein